MTKQNMVVDYLILLNTPALFGKFAHVRHKMSDPNDKRDLTHAEVRKELQAKVINALPTARSRRDIFAIALKMVCERIRHRALFAHMVLAQIQRLVNTLKSNGDIVVMTGDRVNNAPAYQLALSFATGLCSVLWFELLKFIQRH
ncbi:hypothetical protein [Candidatus Nitrotoga sp. M5]|uniref:hypothetical protein n=1 Tax=Candidatus Nitrotoga sp. M5 TaxID=2890409 RepID=UPI001EF6A24C|nr:hypothetical protein [Candidatus Nitrotoga sp. M5]CAH1387089.1 hypothetical protein NTGM5_480085 [Candidatus Nitrotoga sp. M5]